MNKLMRNQAALEREGKEMHSSAMGRRSASPSLAAATTAPNTQTCLPTNRPGDTSRVTRSNTIFVDMPPNETPTLANPNTGSR